MSLSILGTSAFVQPLLALPLYANRPYLVRAVHCVQIRRLCRTRCPVMTGGAPADVTAGSPAPASEGTRTTEETFAADAGRDLFFASMDASMAIGLLNADLGGLEAADDRFIAAERLKFFPSEEATSAILSFVDRFDVGRLDGYVLQDKVARRKAVETLGRFKGRFLRSAVTDCLVRHLEDPDEYMVEVAVWALGEVGIQGNAAVLEKVALVLSTSPTCERVVIQTLMRENYVDALGKIQEFATSPDPTVASAAATCVCVLTNDQSGMRNVVNVLKSDNLSARRAAIEDITLAKYIPALRQVAVAPNSLVLRTRTVRVLLEEQKKTSPSSLFSSASSMEPSTAILNEETAKLVDRLIWDHPGDLDLLGMKKETKKARDVSRNVRQLYKNDAIFPYLAARTLAEDYRESDDSSAGAAVLKSFVDQPYFDYFGAYHVFKTLGWLRCQPAAELLMDNAANLPPRFFNHQAGAILALSEFGDPSLCHPIFEKVAGETAVWELKYACLMASERLAGGGAGSLRERLQNDSDWLVRARARASIDFSHLRHSF